MCGIIGVAGNVHKKEEDVLRTLLILDSLRGEDSTGCAFIHKDGKETIAKELGGPFNLFDSKEFENSLKKANRAIIGHNRYATVGGVSKETAHPFDFETLVGVHNGTLKNKYKLLSAKDFAVDSANLYHHIEQKGLTDALGVIDGAWALVWWDKLEDKLNFLRNTERPLYMTYTENSKTVYWASEEWMLGVALGRHGVKFQAITMLPVDTLLSYEIGVDGKLGKPHMKAAPGTYEDDWIAYLTPANGNWNHKHVHTQTSNPLALAPPAKKALALATSTEEKILETPSEEFVKQYLEAKRVVFEIVASKPDVYGAHYIQLMDLAHPAANVRLYLKKGDPLKNMVGREIIADIGSFTLKKNEGYIFKASSFDVVVVPVKEDTSNYLIYKGVSNKLFTKKEWESLHQNCDWCFDPLFAEDHGNKITSGGNVLCGRCVNNPDAVEGLTLSSVY